MIVQIYEIQTPAEAAKCIELGVDHIGSVLLSRDRWRLTELRDVIRLSRGTKTKNALLPLFQDRQTLFRSIEYYRPHFIHLCETLTDPDGREIPLDAHMGQQQELKQKFPEVGIMRTLPLPPQGAFFRFPILSIAAKLEPYTDLFLADTWLGTEPVDGYIGITGKTADWRMAGELVHSSDIPVILAGGLSPENVHSAVTTVLPAGADSCTQTNQTDSKGRPVRFQKDFERVAKFIVRVRGAEDAIRRRRRELDRKVGELEAELREREAALPAHGVKPQQVLAIEDLEDAISSHEEERKRLEGIEVSRVFSTEKQEPSADG
jgi:phosphoribosylanthranilate isomerase